MKLAELHDINKDPEFSGSWLNSQKHILLALTVGGSLIVLLWQWFDQYYFEISHSRLAWLRVITIIVFGLNAALAMRRKSPRAVKQHLVASFYFGTTFCMLLTMFTGASQSPYWFSLFFIVIAWFVLVPYNFREMVLHSIMFVIIFIAGQFAWPNQELAHHELVKMAFLYSGTLGVSFFASYIRNRLDAENFVIRQRLRRKNAELSKFRLILDQAPGAVFILDKDWNFEYINPFFTNLSGYTAEELLHRNIRDTLYKNIPDIPESRLSIVTALTAGKSWNGELLTYHKNGKKYWANTIATPFRNERGEIDGYMVIQQDITEKKQLEITLSEQEKLYRSLIEKSLDGIVISQDGKVILVNKAFANMLGYSVEECIETFGPHSIAPEDRERVLDIHYRRMKNELEDMRYSASLICRNGDRIVAEFNTTTIEINGKPASLISIRDITERNLMLEAIEKSEKRYKLLVENSLEGITIVRDNKILFANDTYCRMLGYSRDELYTMSSVLTLHPDDRPKAMSIAERRRNRDFSTISEVLRMVTKTGESIECETMSTLIEYDGQWASFFTSHNITERKQMEKALKESEQKYRTLINKATDGILITQDGVFRFVNPAFCEMMQYTENELLEKPFIEVVDKSHHDEMLENHRRRMTGESFPAIYRAKLFRKDGKSIMVELNSRTTDYNGKPASFVITRDITDRLHVEEELRKAKEELEELNQNLENRVHESTLKLTEANTQLIRLQKENLQSQFEVLRQQVNPHFLFNSLNVLTSLIKLEPDLAEKFTEHLSKVYRYVLENKDNDLVSLQTELDFLEAYIFLLHIRFMDKIEVKVDIDDNKKEKKILPLALQLLIENAIKHNSMSKRNPLVIKIRIDNKNWLRVENNLQERESHMASTGVGLKNIEHRYKLLELPAPQFVKTGTEFIACIPLKD